MSFNRVKQDVGNSFQPWKPGRNWDSERDNLRSTFGFSPAQNVPPPPTVDPNAALNASQTTADQLRARRGVLSTIFAGASNSSNGASVTGRTQLGT